MNKPTDREKAIRIIEGNRAKKAADDVNQRSSALAAIIMAGVQGCCGGFSVEQVIHVIMRCAGVIAQQAGWDEASFRLFASKVWESVPAPPVTGPRGATEDPGDKN